MKEEKIMSFTQPGYRLQLLKITETNINGYFQIRENRKIKATFTTLDNAIKKFYAIQGSRILQKDMFGNKSIHKDTVVMQGQNWSHTIALDTWKICSMVCK